MEYLRQMLIKIRQEKGVSQRQLATLAGLDSSFINKIEKGKRGNVTVETVNSIATALGVSPAVFFKSDTYVSLIEPKETFKTVSERFIKLMPVAVPLYTELKIPANGLVPETFNYYRPESLKGRNLMCFRVPDKFIPRAAWYKTSLEVETDLIVVSPDIPPKVLDIVVFVHNGQTGCGQILKNNHEAHWVIRSDDGFTNYDDCETVMRVIEITKRV